MSVGLPGNISVNKFRFLNHSYDPATGEAVLAYSFDDGEAIFERITFPYKPWPSDSSRQLAFDRALSLLHLIAGVSYYKTCVPGEMDTGDMKVDEGLAGFLTRLYVRGLGEFAYTNKIELEDRVNFQANSVGESDPIDLALPDRALLAIGGGKDSLVSLETLRSAGIEIQPVCVGQSELIGQTVKTAGLPLIRIERELSPALALMNEAGALNGHVPVTAINSAILLCASILYGFRWIVFSNESSANEATLHDANGKVVNHQYSKSMAFENDFRDVISSQLSSGIEYFSLLRPLNELYITNIFSELKKYHQVFSSCNRNFHIDGPRTKERWCGDCPKCRFTSLALAPFVEPSELKEIIGFNLLDQIEQEEGFRALCQLGSDKPFECVGTVEESRAAMLHLATLDSWKSLAIVSALESELDELNVPELGEVLAARGEHNIPSGVLKDAAF